MAKDTAKKNCKANEARLKLFQTISLALLAVDVLVAVFLSADGVTWGWTTMFLFWAGQQYAALQLLAACGKPTTHETTGELIDCIDLSDPQQLGIYSYAQDLLWVCWLVEGLTLFSWYAVILYLPVPATVAYKAWTMLLGPLVSRYFSGANNGAPNGDEGAAAREADPRTRLQRRREELRARKGKTARSE